MTVLINILGALLFFALIIVSVLLHELGHLLPAKLFGVKVTEYFAGFGPKIWSKKVGETEYGLKGIPLGGYCKLVGMYPPRKEGAKDTWLQRVADNGREVEYEDITEADDGRLFYQKKTWQKLIVMSGGIIMNLLLAFILFQTVFGLYGKAQATTVVASVNECMVTGAQARPCQDSDPATPAKKAGLKEGDKIVSFNGHDINGWLELSNLIRANGNREAKVVVERAGQRVELQPVNTVINGVRDRIDPGKIVQAGFYGYAPKIEQHKAGPVETVGEMWNMSVQSVYALVMLPAKVYNVVADMVQGHPRDPASPMSIVGASRTAGDLASSSHLTMADKAASVAGLLGSLNLFLFWLNVIPLLPMDGGHIAGAIYEWARRGLAALLKKPDPGPFDTAKTIPISATVFIILAVLGAALIIADIFSPLKIFS